MRDGVSPTGAVGRITNAVPPAAGAMVMGTAIVSIGLSLDHRERLSQILLIVDAAAWLALGLLLAHRTARDRSRVRREAHSPGALTGVAGTAVLGIRLALLGWSWAGIGLLAIATLLWIVLLAPVLRDWVTPTVGLSFVLVVATQSLAVLSAVLAARETATWLLYAALWAFAAGLGFYAFVLARFDVRQILVGRGDHWVVGGALAISTLAAARITLAAHSLETMTSLSGTLQTLSLVLWTLAIAWLPVLLIGEVRRPRPRYDVRRWSTVFPVGMYAVCSFIVGTAADDRAIADFARVWIWVGVAAWVVVFAGMLHRGWQLAVSSPAALQPVQRSPPPHVMSTSYPAESVMPKKTRSSQ
jgi:tellurite resistance protein TehA-like permease